MNAENIVLVIVATACVGILMFLAYVFIAWRKQPTCSVCGDFVEHGQIVCGVVCHKIWITNDLEKRRNA